MNMKLLVSLMLCMIGLSVGVIATNNHLNYGNVGYQESSIDEFISFGSHTPSNHLNTSSACTIMVNSLFSPVIGDINSDGVVEVVVATSSNSINIYNANCGFLQSINFGEEIRSMPILLNTDFDPYLDIIVGGVNNIKWFDFDVGLDKYIITDSISTLSTVDRGLSCVFDNNMIRCIAVQDLTESLSVYNLTDSSGVTIGLGVNVTPGVTHPFRKPLEFRSYASAKITEPVFFEYMPCASSNNGAAFYFPIIDFWGVLNLEPIAGTDAQNNGLRGCVVNTGSLGNTNDYSGIFGVGADNNENYHAYIFDTAGNSRINFFAGSDMSNWALADANIDASNEACLLYLNASTNTDQIVCYDASYTRIFDKQLNVSDGYRGFAMAQFDNSNDMLEFVTADGIYRYDSVSDSFTLISNFSSFVTDVNGSIIVSELSTSRDNGVFYTESSKITIFSFTSAINVSCGDGICSGSESPLTCPGDCLINISAPDQDLLPAGEGCGTNSSLCQSGFCLYGFCTLKGTASECSFDHECVSNSCVSGKCRKAGLWDTLDAGKDESFGDDTNTNNLISLVTMATIGYGLMATGNPFAMIAGVMIIFGFGAFFVSVGWLQFWIFMLMIIMGVAFGTVVLLLKMGQGQ